MKSKKKIFLISLGCAKNLVDSENVLGLLKTNGFPLVSSLQEAEVAIVNTCGFIQSAVEESIDTILEVAKKKRRRELEALFVMGPEQSLDASSGDAVVTAGLVEIVVPGFRIDDLPSDVEDAFLIVLLGGHSRSPPRSPWMPVYHPMRSLEADHPSRQRIFSENPSRGGRIAIAA